ncbi:hypothetical protein O3M35_011704 [Rhynocoris fuscipes]|uniref:Odorant receptor n=1 Tax=Rhynocoris fuscipes TaxID=488301 RepID=A0AAW1D2H7_9HEMI
MGKEDKGRDYYIRKGFKENYGLLMIWGGMYLGHWIIPAVFLIDTLPHLTLLVYTVYLCLDDLGPMAEAMHFLVMLSTACTSVVNSLLQRNRLDKILEAMGRGFFDYGNTLDEESKKEIKVHKDEVHRRKTVFPRLFIICVLISGMVLLSRIYIEYFISGHYKEPRDNGIVMVVIEVYYPFRPSTELYVIAFFFQYIIVFICVGIILGTDITFLCMSEDFCLQLRIIGITLRRCDQRAKLLCKNTLSKQKQNGCILSEQDYFKKCLEYCIAQNVEHHLMIIDLFYDFKRYNRVMLLWLLVGATFLLCLSGILFVSDNVTALSKTTFLLFLSTELVHTFIFCWYGEQMQILSREIGDQCYNSEWFDNSSIIKHYILIVQKRSNVPLRLSAAGYMDVNLNTYSNVCIKLDYI